ncbi:hypothetical protein HY385_01550 [Candidatus Daviesbacteria bacterium]|nr:hypothetical protein [Candidatus Daviesbacteria bacterium]
MDNYPPIPSWFWGFSVFLFLAIAKLLLNFSDTWLLIFGFGMVTHFIIDAKNDH